MTIGIFVRALKCSIGIGSPATVSKALRIGGGTSPSGNTNPLPGSNDTMPFTRGFLIAVSQPGPPPCECVNTMPSPIRSNSADILSEMTLASYGPVLGVIDRKN